MSRRERQRRRRRNKGGPHRIIFLTLGLVATAVAIAGIAAVGWVVAIANSAPDLDKLKPVDQGATSVVYAADGERLGFIQSSILRTPVSSREIPQTIKDATVAIEDKRFYEHKGVDFEGVVRAAIKNFNSGKTVQGGSTLTMQLIRNIYNQDRSKSFKRKIREAKLAQELEDKHPHLKGKKWILTKYLNNVPYGTVGGQSAIGIQAASRIFFNKPAAKLKLAESALLVGLPQAPSQYNPFTSVGEATGRRNEVLDQMAKEGYITRDTANRTMRKPLGVKHSSYYTFRREGYFFDYVKQELIDQYGSDKVRRGGLSIYTTIDLKLQQAARKAMIGKLGAPDRASAIVSIDPANGYIKAMATSARYGDLKFNLAAQGHRQPGSTFKTMVLMTALRRGVDPTATTYTSQRLKFVDPTYGPIDVKTYSNTYLGRVNLVQATLKSDNSVFQQLDLDLGPDAVRQTAYDMGIKTRLNGYPAEGLGGLKLGVSPLEMANAYATIASGGWRNRPKAVTRVCFKDTGKCEDLSKPHRTRAFDDGVTYEATQILEKNIEAGTGTGANIGCPAGGKTGTTDGFTDAWFVGFTPRLATSTWVGHPDSRLPMPGVAGGTIPATIWHDYMSVAKGKFCGDFPKPKVPFQSAPFFGRYAKTGVRGNTSDTTGQGTTPTTGAGAPTTGPGGTSYPPQQYESPPQPAPKTVSPPKDTTPQKGATGNGGQQGPGGGTTAPPGR